MKISIHTNQKTLSVIVLCFIFVSFACGSPSSVTPVSPSSAATVSLSDLITSTSAPILTVIIQPSEMPLPSATPTSLVADLGQVVFSEDFNDLEFPFNVWGPKRIESGVLVLDETPTDQLANGIYGILPIPPGVTTIVLFKTVGATTFNIGYHAGDYGAESLRRFSFNSSQGVWDLYQGNVDSTGSGNYPVENWNARQINFDVWNYFSITRTADGNMEARLWERDKPETMFRFQGNLGAEWGMHEFTFFVDFRSGSFILDEYQELK